MFKLIFFTSLIKNVSVREKGRRGMSAEGSSVKGSSQQSFTSIPKVKGGGPLFSGPGPLIIGGLVNDTAFFTILQGTAGNYRAGGFVNSALIILQIS